MLESLKFRTMLCFAHMEGKNCTVTNIAKSLGEEKYAVSRAMSSLEKDGYLDKSERRNPILTKEGEKLARKYEERMDIALNHLLYHRVPDKDARKDALNLALYCTDSMFERLSRENELNRMKELFEGGRQFDGGMLARRLKDGEYPFPFVIYKDMRSRVLPDARNQQFEYPAVFEVQGGAGYLCLKEEKGVVKSLRKVLYFDGDSMLEARKEGKFFFFPAAAFRFLSKGKEWEQRLYGTMEIQLFYEKGDNERAVLAVTL